MSKQPIHSLKDAQDLRFWSWSGYPVFQSTLDALGIKNQVSLSLPEVLPSLQTGIIDATAAMPFGFLSLQWYTEQRYILEDPLLFVTAAMVMTRSSFEKLPPPYQEVVLKVMHEGSKEFMEATLGGEKGTYQALLDYGIEPLHEPALTEELKRDTQSVAKDMTGKYWSQGFYNEMVGLRDQCRALRSNPEAVEPR
jgi:TRAP-type C4-dicarboxylate transport system substrate-binding protein